MTADSSKLLPLFHRVPPIWCFTPREALVTALDYMEREDYSQVVVRLEDRLSLLTVEGIAGWLRNAAKQGVFDLKTVTVGDALRFELPDNSLVVSGTSTVRDAREAFASSIANGHARLYALIVTQTGAHHEDPLGIVTPWDLTGPER